MTPKQLADLIQDDLTRNKDSLSWHGRPIEQGLCEPHKSIFLDAHNHNEPIELWLVFEELEEGHGYKVIYSEADQAFGLAMFSQPKDTFVGIHGGFVHTLNSM